MYIKKSIFFISNRFNLDNKIINNDNMIINDI
jgi:hypothetical protein